MDREWSKKQADLIQRHIKDRGVKPSERMLTLLEWDPDFFEIYLNLSTHPWKKGTIPPKFKELIYVAIDASTTHLYEPGIRNHMRLALEQGATKEQILEVLEMVTILGIHTCAIGMPALDSVYKQWQAENKGK